MEKSLFFPLNFLATSHGMSGNLTPPPGIKHVPLALGAQSYLLDCQGSLKKSQVLLCFVSPLLDFDQLIETYYSELLEVGVGSSHPLKSHNKSDGQQVSWRL